jgi:DNA-binding NarL/FixJ family response regulator
MRPRSRATSTAADGERRSEEPPADPARITVAIGRFGALIGRGLAQLIGEDMAIKIVASDLDVPALLRSVTWRAPHVAVLDVEQVGELSGLSTLQALAPETGIVLLAHRPSLARSTTLFAGGATCVSIDASATDLLLAVRLAARGTRRPSPSSGSVNDSKPSGDPYLTAKEAQVLEHLSKGRSHAEIAFALNIGSETERTHANRVRHKLGVRSKRALIGFPVSSLPEIPGSGGQRSLTA